MAKQRNEVVTADVATKDVERWLDFKQVSETEREENSDSIKKLVDEIKSGRLSIDDNCNITYVLKFPIGSGGGIVDITLKPRLTVSEMKEKCGGLKPGDVDGKLCAYASALSGQNRSLILTMDTKDYSVIQSIVSFFI